MLIKIVKKKKKKKETRFKKVQQTQEDYFNGYPGVSFLDSV
jgi:hypothetical protein